MVRKTTRALLVLMLAAAGLALGAGSASAALVSIDLCAESGTLALPGGVTVPIWGFGTAVAGPGGLPTCTGVAAQLPGPALTVAQGDAVQVVVHNDLGEAVSFEAPGLGVSQGSAPAHGVATFTFNASGPGTYLYSSVGRQQAMGLYGALVVRSPVANQAYGTAATAFDREAILVLSAIDPAFNANPNGFDLHAYNATFWLINGRAYPQTDPIHGGSAGQRVLLRYVNAGYDHTTMALLGVHERVVARDAHPLGNPFLAAAEVVPAGGTEDAIVTIPASGNRFALFNRQLHVTNGSPANASHTPGGMMTFLVVP